MERAIWKSDHIIAWKVADDYNMEHNVRIASSDKELYCPDPQCKNPILCYKHGDIRAAHFAHLSNTSCDYARFDCRNPASVKKVCRSIHRILDKKGFCVLSEQKILDHHYTHLLISLEHNQRIAIEIRTKQISAKEIDKLEKAYKEHGLSVKWVVVDDEFNAQMLYNNLSWLKTHILNTSKNHDLIVINSNDMTVLQKKHDTNRYLYNGFYFPPMGYRNDYIEESALENLTLENSELTIEGFYDRYIAWQTQKQVVFNAQIQQNKEERQRERKQFEENERIRKAQLEKQRQEETVERPQQPQIAHQKTLEEKRRAEYDLIKRYLSNNVPQQKEQQRKIVSDTRQIEWRSPYNSITKKDKQRFVNEDSQLVLPENQIELMKKQYYVGAHINDREFGDGVVDKIEGDSIYIRFGERVRKRNFKVALNTGYLTLCHHKEDQ